MTHNIWPLIYGKHPRDPSKVVTAPLLWDSSYFLNNISIQEYLPPCRLVRTSVYLYRESLTWVGSSVPRFSLSFLDTRPRKGWHKLTVSQCQFPTFLPLQHCPWSESYDPWTSGPTQRVLHNPYNFVVLLSFKISIYFVRVLHQTEQLIRHTRTLVVHKTRTTCFIRFLPLIQVN